MILNEGFLAQFANDVFDKRNPVKDAFAENTADTTGARRDPSSYAAPEPSKLSFFKCSA